MWSFQRGFLRQSLAGSPQWRWLPWRLAVPEGLPEGLRETRLGAAVAVAAAVDAVGGPARAAAATQS